MTGAKLKLLQALDEAKAPLDFKEIASRAEISLASALGHLRALERSGLVSRTPGLVVTFAITAQGRSLLGPFIPRDEAERLLVRLPPENVFLFYKGVGVSVGKSASSLPEFAQTIRDLEEESIEFHLDRGDFEKWITFIGDHSLSSRVSEIKNLGLRGPNLRDRLYSTIKSRVDELEKAGSR